MESKFTIAVSADTLLFSPYCKLLGKTRNAKMQTGIFHISGWHQLSLPESVTKRFGKYFYSPIPVLSACGVSFTTIPPLIPAPSSSTLRLAEEIFYKITELPMQTSKKQPRNLPSCEAYFPASFWLIAKPCRMRTKFPGKAKMPECRENNKINSRWRQD